MISPGPTGPQFAAETSGRGEWVRQRNHFTQRVTAGSASAPGEGPDAAGHWPVEPGRYRLVVSKACPWAHRAIIVRELLGLTGAISLAVVDPIRDEAGWRFPRLAPRAGDTPGPGPAGRDPAGRDPAGLGSTGPDPAERDPAGPDPAGLDPAGRDPVLGISYLSEAYLATDPGFTGRVTVPCLVDTYSGRVVTNDYPQLTLDLSTEWRAHHGPDAPDLYPEALRERMQPLLDAIYLDVNNGVYRCGFASTQEAYEAAYHRLFARLDDLETRLGRSRFLLGDEPLEVDVRLFTTLVRFDAAYHGHFKCNRNKLTELPNLWRYARELYRRPGWGDTVDFDHIKRHYYGTHRAINPTGIVPLGPDESLWHEPG